MNWLVWPASGLAVLAGWHLYEPIGNKISEFTRLTGQDSYLTGFVVTACAVGLIMFLARWTMKQLMELTFNPVLNRAGGALAGLLRATLLLSAVFIGMSLCRVDYLRTKFTEESIVGSTIRQHVMPVYQSLIEDKPDSHSETELPPTHAEAQNHDNENGADRMSGMNCKDRDRRGTSTK